MTFPWIERDDFADFPNLKSAYTRVVVVFRAKLWFEYHNFTVGIKVVINLLPESLGNINNIVWF